MHQQTQANLSNPGQPVYLQLSRPGITFAPVSTETLVGTTVAGYTVKARVGEGGTSTVYRAEHPVHGTVALKVLREKLRQDKTAVARFLREAQFGVRVEHPHIVRTLEFGEVDGDKHYLAIEWAKGEMLDKYADRSGPLPVETVVAIMQQLGGAVQCAHDSGIVHRDLKPENVMYDPETGSIKLLDFGIAAETDAAPDQRLTRAGFFVGTLMYVAPEALSGELVGPGADQYSLATIAYYLLTSELPYTGKSPRELFSQLLTLPPIPLNQARANCRFSTELEEVVMKALSRQPAARYPSVQAFVDAFSAAALIPPPAHPANGADGGKGTLMNKMKGLFRR